MVRASKDLIRDDHVVHSQHQNVLPQWTVQLCGSLYALCTLLSGTSSLLPACFGPKMPSQSDAVRGGSCWKWCGAKKSRTKILKHTIIGHWWSHLPGLLLCLCFQSNYAQAIGPRVAANFGVSICDVDVVCIAENTLIPQYLLLTLQLPQHT